MLTILVDENIDGYAAYLSRLVSLSEMSDICSLLGIVFVRFDEVGLAKGTPDDGVWEFCQQERFWLITDNRNQESPDSLESMIRTRNLPTSLPIFTISDIERFRSEKDYAEAVVAKLVEYLFDAEDFLGTGRLFLP